MESIGKILALKKKEAGKQRFFTIFQKRRKKI